MSLPLKPYPAYKDSGVPWLGQVPEHWEVRRQRNVAQLLVSNVDKLATEGELPVRLCNYTDVYKNERITAKLPFMRATARPDEIARFRLTLGDVIITKDSESWNDIGVPALVECQAPDLVCGYHLAVLRPREGAVCGGFLLRALQSRGVAYQYHVQANGVTRYGLSHDAIKSVQVPVPPLPEQSAIVRFLDHADRRIRKYIAAKRKLIRLLEEQKQAIIHQAVTRGLDPTVKLKPSGVEWLGDIPEHWEVAALRHRYLQCLGKMLDTKRITGQCLLPYLRNTDVQWDHIRVDGLPTMDIMPTEYERYTLRCGDLLVCEGGEVGRCALWTGQLSTCGFQKALHRLRPIDDNRDVPRFMYYAFRAAAHRNAFSDGHVSTIAHLTGDKLRAHRFAFPPVAEQQSMVRFLDALLGKQERAASLVTRDISLLREYRTRLVSDVVTGKLDVRGVELPEELEDLAGLEPEASEAEEAEAAGSSCGDSEDDIGAALREET